MFSRRFIFFVSSIIAFYHCTAQQSSKLVFTHISIQDGLSNNNINSITQDSSGFIWIGTSDGLNRYDGRHIKTYRFDPLHSNSLPNNVITGIAIDKNQLIWIGTNDGLCSINLVTDSAVIYKNAPADAGSLSNNYQPYPFIDTNNDLWVGTDNGLDYFDRKHNRFIHYPVPPGTMQKNNSPIRIRKITEDKYHRLWCAGLSCFLSFTKENKTFTAYTSGLKSPLFYDVIPKNDSLFFVAEWSGGLTEFNVNTNSFTKVLPGAASKITLSLLGYFYSGKNVLLTGTDVGLVIVNRDNNEIEILKHDNAYPASLCGNRINCIFKDRQNIVWLGTQNGISLLNPQLQLFINAGIGGSEEFGEPDVLAENGNTYTVAVSDFKGLYEFDKNWKLIKQIPSVPPYSSSSGSKSIFHIWFENNVTWYSTDSGLVKYDEEIKRHTVYLPQSEANSNHQEWQIRKVVPYGDGLFAVRTWNSGIYFFDKKNGRFLAHFVYTENNANSLANNNVLEIIVNNRNELYVSTADGLCRYNPSAPGFITYRPNPQAAGLSNFLGKMAEDKNGNLWITSLQGLFFFNTKTNQFTRYTTADGLANNQNHRVCIDKNGRLWISSMTGISMFDPLLKQFYNFSTHEGLPTNYFDGLLTSMNNGLVAAGYSGGITLIDPDNFPFNREIPAVTFSEIRILDKPYTWHFNKDNEKEITLNHNQNVINISFAVLNFTSSGRNKFFYRLEGFDKDWRQSPDGSISYTNLSPGKYTLSIKGSNNSGVMNEDGDRLLINIIPPFTQTAWFRITGILIALGAGLAYFRWRINSVHKKAEMKQKIAETEMMALRAQMNPHFIFNCINSIDALIQSNDKYHATVYLNKFAKLIRNILDSSKQNTVPLSKDIETLQLYIDLEQFRNENKFTAEIITDNALLQDDYKVPPLIVQPYVENAILHGLRNRQDNNGKLLISVLKNNEEIQYIIEDNGTGRNHYKNGMVREQEKKSYGMQMSHDRVKLFNQQEQASVKITDLTENGAAAGTKVEVSLKIK